MEVLSQAINKIIDESALNENGVAVEINRQLLIVLDEMMDRGEDIDAAMVSSLDGIAWAEKLSKGFDQHRFAAMSGAMLALSDNLVKEANKGQINNVIIESENGHIFLLHAGQDLILTVFTRSKDNLGMSLAHAKIATQTISVLLNKN